MRCVQLCIINTLTLRLDIISLDTESIFINFTALTELVTSVRCSNVWLEFLAEESKDSEKLVKYRVQDLPEDRIESAIDHLTKNNLIGEPSSNVVSMFVLCYDCKK